MLSDIAMLPMLKFFSARAPVGVVRGKWAWLEIVTPPYSTWNPGYTTALQCSKHCLAIAYLSTVLLSYQIHSLLSVGP